MLLNNWKDGTPDDVFSNFDGTRWGSYRNDEDPLPLAEKPAFKGAEILLASYGTPSYEGYAFVLFRRDGKLYEVNGSHCSCYGLEGQWDPEETTVQALRHRLDEGELGNGGYDENPFADELRQVLEVLEFYNPEGKVDIGALVTGKSPTKPVDLSSRVEALAVEADTYAHTLYQMRGEQWHKVRDEYFAQAVARQCADIAEHADSGELSKGDIEFSNQRGLDAANAIRARFGLEG